jgi:hypothetical protein
MPGSSHLGVTAGSRHTCDPHGCCTLNGFSAVRGPRSDRVLIWELTDEILTAWVEVLKGWGCGVGRRQRGGGTVDRPLGEVRGVRYRGEWNLIGPLFYVLFMSIF